MVSFLYLRLQRSCVPCHCSSEDYQIYFFSYETPQHSNIEADASNSFKTLGLLSTTESETDVGVNGDRAMCYAAVHIQAVDNTHLITIVLVGLACFAKLC